MVHTHNFYGFNIKQQDKVFSLEDAVAKEIMDIILQGHSASLKFDEGGMIATFVGRSTATVQKQGINFILNDSYNRDLSYVGVSDTPEGFSDEVIDRVNDKLAYELFPMQLIKEAPNGDITLIQDPRAVAEPQIHLILKYTEPTDETNRKLSKLNSDLAKTEAKVDSMKEPTTNVTPKEEMVSPNED